MERRVLHASRDLHPGWSIAVGPALALLYVVALVVGRATRVDGSQVALVWPAAAVAVGWLLWEWRTGALWARATVVTITGLAAAVVPLVDDSPWWLALAAGVGNGLMAVVAVAVFVRLGGPDAHRLRTPQQLWALLLGATAGAVAGAAFVPLALVLLGGEPVEVIAIWVVRNLVSVFVLVACCLRLPRRLPRSLADLAPARWPEVALGGAALVAALTAVVLVDSDRPVAFFVIALAVWAGLRLHTGSSAVVSLVGSLAVVVATVDGAGPFADAPLLVRVVLAQAFMGVVVLVTMALALQRDAQQALAASLGASEGRFRSAFETAPMGMLMAPVTEDGPGPITRVNHDLSAFVGRSPSEIVGTRIERLLDLRDLDAFAAATTTSDAEAPPPRTEVRFRRPDGETAWALVSKTVIRDPDGDTLLCLVEDITARKEAEAALGRHALHDHLTGLPNRTLLVDRLERAIRTGGAARAGVVYLDLDGFKAHNENLGHSGGDDLLVRVGSRIAGCVGAIDTVARLGGDEFVVLCEDLVGMSELESVADRIRAALSEPVHVAGAPVQVGASVGLAIADPGADPEAVLREADQAMSAAKQSGRLGSSLVLPEAARAARTMRLVPELERALAGDEFEMFGQPVVDLATGRTVAVETLLRWRHPRLGLVAPSGFLDVLENSTLMVEAGARVLAMSMRMARQWIDALGTEAPAVHVNVSGAQLQDGHLSAAVRTAQLAAGVPLSQIVLELTETHAPLIADSLLSDVSDLRRDGVRIALDDLGTGYSSLQRITELPTDILKIDRTFVDGLGSNPRCSAIVRGVLSMSQALGLSVIAEGVETPEQHALLHQHDCDTAQGFLYARPMPADALLATLTGSTSLLPH